MSSTNTVDPLSSLPLFTFFLLPENKTFSWDLCLAQLKANAALPQFVEFNFITCGIRDDLIPRVSATALFDFSVFQTDLPLSFSLLMRCSVIDWKLGTFICSRLRRLV